MDTLIPSAAEPCRRPGRDRPCAEALAPGGRGRVERDREERGGCRRPCSTSCMRRGCSVCCCRGRRTGSRPIQSPSSMSSRPSRAAMPRTAWCLSQAGGCAMTAAYLEPAGSEARSSVTIRAPCWPGGPARRSKPSNARAATGSLESGPLRPAAGTPPGWAPTARSSRPTARHAWTRLAGSRSAPCWCAPATFSGRTSGTRSACAAPRATSSRSTTSSCAPTIRSPATSSANAANRDRSTGWAPAPATRWALLPWPAASLAAHSTASSTSPAIKSRAG